MSFKNIFHCCKQLRKYTHSWSLWVLHCVILNRLEKTGNVYWTYYLSASVFPTIFDRNNLHYGKLFGSQLRRRAETHVVCMQCPLFSLDFNPNTKAVKKKSFIKLPNIKFHENPFGGSSCCTRADRHTAYVDNSLWTRQIPDVWT